jgi:hypothetical protein
VNPRVFLAREVQPLLIYVRGADRLNQHQSNKHIYNFFVFIYSYPCILLLILCRYSRLEAANPRGSRGGQADIGQPIAAARPDGVPPGRAGFLVSKAPAGLSCVPRFRRAFLGACCRTSRSASRVHGGVFVCEHFQARVCPQFGYSSF